LVTAAGRSTAADKAGSVPRFFFHVYDTIEALDEEGYWLPDADAARRDALLSARALICEQVKLGTINLTYRIEVVDEAGDTVLDLPYSAAVSIVGC
jgi:hypothetical protein